MEEVVASIISVFLRYYPTYTDLGPTTETTPLCSFHLPLQHFVDFYGQLAFDLSIEILDVLFSSLMSLSACVGTFS